MGFLQFIEKYAMIGILVAAAGLLMFLRYRNYDDATGKKSTVPKAIAVVLFIIGAIWVISPLFIKLAIPA